MSASRREPVRVPDTVEQLLEAAAGPNSAAPNSPAPEEPEETAPDEDDDPFGGLCVLGHDESPHMAMFERGGEGLWFLDDSLELLEVDDDVYDYEPEGGEEADPFGPRVLEIDWERVLEGIDDGFLAPSETAFVTRLELVKALIEAVPGGDWGSSFTEPGGPGHGGHYCIVGIEPEHYDEATSLLSTIDGRIRHHWAFGGGAHRELEEVSRSNARPEVRARRAAEILALRDGAVSLRSLRCYVREELPEEELRTLVPNRFRVTP